MAKWQNVFETQSRRNRNFFRPWMLAERRHAPALTQPCAVPDIDSADPEIRMSHDRLSWVLLTAIQNEETAWQAVAKWLEGRWQNRVACCDSYSISERLCNLILLWNIKDPPLSLGEPLLHMMRSDADHLLANPEYHGESGTNNHILNNARALVLTGTFLGNHAFYEAGCWLFEHQLGRHVSSDGVLREASTHYQWVVTRWVLEVACAFHAVDQRRFLQLRALLESMLDTCAAMQLGVGANEYLPLLGDISPDFPPWFYRGMTDFGYAVVGCGDAVVSDPIAATGLWPQFFMGRKKTPARNWLSNDKSWARLANDKWSLLAHSDTHTHENRVTHGHHDLFSFELAFDGTPIIVDSGRKNYLTGRDDEEGGILDEWHNTILVDGHRTGFVPRGYMPVSWLDSIRTCPNIVLEEGSLDICLDAPHEVPGISSIQRILNLADDNKLEIFNRITAGSTRRSEIRLVMYVLGNVSVLEDGMKLNMNDRTFMLRWKGLDMPAWRATSRYIGYGMSEPCTRLEWRSNMSGKEWTSVIEVLAGEGRA